MLVVRHDQVAQLACIGRRDIERAAAQEHFIDLCRMLGQPTPNDADPTGDWYAFWANGRVSLMASAAAYAWLVMRVDRLHPGHPGPRHRTAFFLGGLGSLALAILSPIDALSDSLATVHMVQHMLLLMAAAPLFATSGLATLLLGAATHRAYRLISADFLIATGTSGGQPRTA